MDTTGWTTWALPDPRLGMPVLGLKHPPGWTAQGQVTWVPEHNESPERHRFQVTHPDRIAMVQGWPRFDFSWPGGAPWQPTMAAILDGTIANPAWTAALSQVGQHNMDAYAARAASARWDAFQAERAGIAAVGAAAADLRATQSSNAQAQFDRMMQPPPMAGTPGVSAQEAWRNALCGVEAIEDPNSREGNTKYVSSSTAVTWQNELGEVIDTDDVNLDPNIDSHTTWKVVRRYQQ